MDIKDEVLCDFKRLMSEIDFDNYKPNSPIFSNALSVGLMWKLLSDLPEIEVETHHEEYVEKDDISSELDDAEKYLRKYLSTLDIQFKQMAMDELRHATILIKREYAKSPDEEFSVRLQNHELRLRSISEQLV